MSFATSVTMNGDPIDLVVPTALVINRGTEPSLLELVVRDEEDGGTRYDDIDNPVTITIVTPGKYQDSAVVKLENWYIVRTVPHSPGLVKMVLMDCRWTAEHKRVTKEYNVYVAGYGTDNDTKRQSSLRNNGELWTCYEAAIDAIQRFGLLFKEDQNFPQNLKDVRLPRNLGNSPAGGFVAAKWSYMLPLLLDPIHCDPVITEDGKITIVDRQSEASTGLQDYVGVEGSVGDRKTDWETPKEVDLLFQQRVARRFQYIESQTVASSADLGLENVIPQEERAGGGVITEGHEELFEAIRREWGLTAAQIRSLWLGPRVMPQGSRQDAQSVIDRKDRWEAYLRESYRQKFRVVDKDGLNTFADILIGHLGADGSTRSDRCVYMPFAYIHKYTYLKAGQTIEQYWETTISSNVSIDFENPAPWQAFIFFDQKGEVIVQLLPQLDWIRYAREITPGHIDGGIRFGDAVDIQDDNHVLPTQGQSILSTGYLAYIYYHGLLVTDRPDLGLERLHKVTKTINPAGKVDKVQYRVDDITANWGHVDSAAVLSDDITLLNEAEIEQRAVYLQEQIKRNFADGRAGVFKCAGVDAVANGDYWVRGNIHSMTFLIGAKKAYTVETQWVVMPEVRPLYVNALKLQGLPVRTLG